MGIRAAATGRLHLQGVTLPEGAPLGGGDPAVYAECLHRARLARCATAVGTARAVLDHVIPYVNDRQAFGEPISHRQAVAFAVSDIAVELESRRLATWRAASRADMGKPFAHETAIARRLCAVKGMEIGSQDVQLLGGHGYVEEYTVERWYRDLRATGVMEGALLVSWLSADGHRPRSPPEVQAARRAGASGRPRGPAAHLAPMRISGDPF